MKQDHLNPPRGMAAKAMALSGGERMQLAAEWSHAVREIILASLPPELPDHERKNILYEMIYGEKSPF